MDGYTRHRSCLNELDSYAGEITQPPKKPYKESFEAPKVPSTTYKMVSSTSKIILF